MNQFHNSRWEHWISHPFKARDASLQLFCFPFAGGGASIFRPFAAALGDHIQVCSLMLPGRESRLREPPVRDMQQLAALVTDAIRHNLTQARPVAFLGYSLGAILAFEVARRLCRSGTVVPALLVAASSPAPHVPYRMRRCSDLHDNDLRRELERLGGSPRETLQNPDLLRLVLPYIRADFSLLETYLYDSDSPLPCPILSIYGANDNEVLEADQKAWRYHTSSCFNHLAVPGDHFFLLRSPEVLAAAILPFLTKLR
jgi:medium-chain acyl-[acyl-carrier-protein] hydrolase